MRADDASSDTTWTADRIAILESMWAGGATAAAIADRLGLSRSAVLGKIFRLRLRTANAEQPEAEAVCDPIALARRRSNRPRRRGARSPSLPSQPERPQRPGISLLDLTNETCRFPHGDPGTPGFYFCGAPGADLEGGRPYCARHARLAYSRAAIAVEDEDDEAIVALLTSPSIAPFDSPRRYVWRTRVKHPAPRWR